MDEQAEKIYLLFLDDELDFLELVENTLDDSGYEVLTASTIDGAMSLLAKHHQDILTIISDFHLDDENGFEFRDRLEGEMREIPFFILSGAISRELALEGMDKQITGFLEKPILLKPLLKLLEEKAKDRAYSIEERRLLSKIFAEESQGILEELEPLLLDLENDPNDTSVIDIIFRLVHTIKGSSGAVGAVTIKNFVHKYEDLLGSLRNRQIAVTSEIVSILLQGFDTMKEMLNDFHDRRPLDYDVDELAKIFDVRRFSSQRTYSEGEHKKTNSSKSSESGKKQAKISVNSELLDQFMVESGEITVIRNMLNKLVRIIETEFPGNQNIALLDELLEEMHKKNSSMQKTIEELKKVSLTKVYRPLQRAIRDAANALGKTVDVKFEGDDLRIDSNVGMVLGESLIHVVRNAVDHGIEDHDTRTKSGKPQAGCVTLNTKITNGIINLRVRDDGRGIDSKKIRQKLYDKGELEHSAISKMSDSKVFNMLFEPGFSTAEKVTDLSGRGVGMDMVRSRIEGIGGNIQIESTVGEGSTFHLEIPEPKSVVIVNSLLVEVKDQTFAIPHLDVDRLMHYDEINPSDIKHLEGGSVLEYDHGNIPLVYLSDIFCQNRVASEEGINIVVIKLKHMFYALVVDKIVDSEDVVVKKVEMALDRHKIYRGATFLGSGEVGLVLNMNGIAEAASLESIDFVDKNEESVTSNESSNTREIMRFNLERDGHYAVDLDQVFRLEHFESKDIKIVSGQDVMIYRGVTIPIYNLAEMLDTHEKTSGLGHRDIEFVNVLVYRDPRSSKCFGFAVQEIEDVIQVDATMDERILDNTYLAGTIILSDQIRSIVDFQKILVEIGQIREKEEPEITGNIIDFKIEENSSDSGVEEEIDYSASMGFF